MKSAIDEAKKILIQNRRKNYTLPTNNNLYPAQWNWDSAFISLGYSYFNLNYALDELETLLSGQWNDGMVPHILFHDLKTNYYPNHSVWNCGNKIRSSGITQPPIAASILKIIIKNNILSDKQNLRVKLIILKLKKFHEWLIRFRDPNNSGLISILHPWESGYDNSPLWDKPLNAIKIDKNLKYIRGDNKVVNPEFRPLDIDYDRYVTIKNHLRENNYNPRKLYKKSMFNVVDVGFNSIFLKASKDLLEIAKNFKLNFTKIGKYSKLSENKIKSLYKKKHNNFICKDLKSKKDINVPSITNYFPLFADFDDNKINNQIVNSLKNYNKNENYFFSSINPKYSSYEEKRYWRGPVWINCNWILYRAMKTKDRKFSNLIKQKTIDLIEKKGFFEYYSSKTGKAMGANNFSWSAALYLDLKMNIE